MGIEGNMARVYWRFLSESLPQPYQFPKRSRRPAQDMFNAALNYLYGMLYSVTESAALAAGLDTHLGFLHADEYNRPTFVFDLIEPYRPWIDKLLFNDYMAQRILFRGRRLSRKNHIYRFAGEFAQKLLKEEV